MSTKERPILFSGPMVRAILEGRKTQTRRIVTKVAGFGKVMAGFDKSDTPGYDFHFRCKRGLWQDLRESELLGRCPYGNRGDRLWVRETHCKYGGGYIYRADYGTHTPISDGIGGPWKPSIHMPRVASRITLEITGVRVERLNDIGEADAIAEGVSSDMPIVWQSGDDTPRGMFGELWEAINGPDSWDANPWVWVVEFSKFEPPAKSTGDLLCNLRKSSGNAWDDVVDVRAELDELRGTDAVGGDA